MEYIFLLALLYVAPILVAAIRKHNNVNALSVINLFFGWTFLGWVICLAWSFSDNVKGKLK